MKSLQESNGQDQRQRARGIDRPPTDRHEKQTRETHGRPRLSLPTRKG